MLTPVVVVIAIGLICFLAYVTSRPGTLHVERSVVIRAAPDRIYPLVNGLGQWKAWSPYEKKDPAMQRTLSGPESGVGAAYAWQGNNKVGAGTMEIIESSPPARIRIQLHFVKPFEGRTVAEFSFIPGPDGTRVTWAMDGPSPFISKLMGVIFDMDKMIGNDFADGLQNLKTLAEA
jgi:hypothetical protein